MSEYKTNISGLNATNNRIGMLMADFSGLKNLEKHVDSVLKNLSLKDNVQQSLSLVRSGAMSRENFDGWMAELVRKEMGKKLAIIRANAVQKAHDAGAGSAAGAVLRRTYKDSFTVNINIAGHRGRMSSRTRVVPPPDGGKSGIHRNRSVKPRTQTLREYYGPDRDFILRIFSEGRDVFYATPEGPTGRGSKATYGKRGAMAPRWNFVHSMQSDMQQAAEQLGIELTGYVEKWIETQFKEG